MHYPSNYLASLIAVPAGVGFDNEPSGYGGTQVTYHMGAGTQDHDPLVRLTDVPSFDWVNVEVWIVDPDFGGGWKDAAKLVTEYVAPEQAAQVVSDLVKKAALRWAVGVAEKVSTGR
jgi:hypothetical protein